MGPAIAQEPERVPAFPAKAEAMTVDVVVLDKSGRPIRNLSKDDFTVLEDGRPQPIVGFQAWEASVGATVEAPSASALRVGTNERLDSASGRAFALVIDDLGLDPIRSGADVKQAAARWLEEKADPRDLLTLATTSGDVWWSDQVASGREDLLAVLGRVKGKKQPEPATGQISDWEAYRISTYEGGTVSAEEALPGNTTTCVTQGVLAGSGVPQTVEDRVIARWFGSGGCPCSSMSGPGAADVVAASIRSCRSLVRARARQVQEATTRRAQALFGTIERLSHGLTGWRGRKSIIVLSEGLIRDTHLASVQRAIDASQRGNTAVYFVDARGLAGESFYGAQNAAPPAGIDMAAIASEETLLSTAGTEYVADATGGSTLRDTNDLLGGLERLADESSAYYLLGYQPEKAPDARWRKLEVRVSRAGATVRARKGYTATASAPSSPPPTKGRRLLDPAAVAGGDRGDIALRSSAYVLDGDDAGGARILVALEVDTSKLTFEGAGEQRTATLDLTLVGVSRDKPKIFPVDERVRLSVDAKAVGGWWVFSREIHLPAGVAQTRVLVRDTASGLTGSVTQRFDVPGISGPFLASPILTDRLVTAPTGEQRLVPVAHRLFRAPGRLYCGYDVHGAAKASIGYSLETGGGRTVSLVPPAPVFMDANGRSVGLLALPIDDLEDGPYELVLNVEDGYSGRSMQAREPFVLERVRQ
jgi:VWFA-related protein